MGISIPFAVSALLKLSAVVLQLTAAFFALRLIRVTGGRASWALIAGAFCIMAFRRSFSLWRLVSGDPLEVPNLVDEVVALTISAFMVAGVLSIAPLFRTIERSADFLRRAKDELEIKVVERTEELRDANARLSVELDERRRAEQQLIERTQDLRERVKELNCLYSITSLMGEPNISLEKILQRVLELIPPAWQYPNITCARIKFEGCTFRTATFRETQWRQASDIIVNGDCLGSLEVFYRREKPTIDEGPFLKEERSLLETIAKALGVITARKQAEKEITRLASFPQLNPYPVLEIDASGAIIFYNPATVETLEKLGAAGPGDFLPEDLGEIQVAARETGERVFYREVKIKDAVFGERIHFAEPFNVVRIYASNITARNQAQQKLRESEENLRYLASQILTAQERERRRISRELHDSAAQELSALKIGLENLLADSPEKPVEELNPRISGLLQGLQKTLTSIRTLSYDLRPPDLEHFGLVQAIKTHCEEFTARTGIKVDFMAAGIEAGHLDYDAAINFYRIIQEGLINVWRHSQAMNVNLRLVASFPKIILRLEDDGQGFDVMEQEASRHGNKHLGLLGMRERVALLGGEMKIESQLEKGTKISIEIPWKGEDLGTKEETPHC